MDLATILIEQNPDGVLGFDRECRYTIWNPAMERITGLRRGEVIGRNAFELFPFLRETGEHRCFEAALAGTTAVSRDQPYRIVQTGHIGHFDGHYIPLRDALGQVSGAIGLIRDVTATHEAEARARESRELFESYMAHIPGVAFVKDADGRHVFANRLFEQAHGLQPGQWRGKLDAEIFPAATAERFRANDLEVLASGQPLQMVDQQGARNEPEHWMWVKFPLRDARGRQMVAGLAFNVTEQHRAEQALRTSEERFRQLFAELQEANRRKDEFLATLGHELRNPLAPLITAAELLRIQPAAEGVAQRAQEVIARQAQQMRRLIDDLLDVARITRGIVSLKLETIDLRDPVEGALRTAETWFGDRQLRVRTSLPPEPVQMRADRVRIEQIVTNLLSNAAKFTPPGGEIFVSLLVDDMMATLSVRDTGKGIPPEMLGGVFDLFTQVNPSADRAEGGLGLGLTIVKRLTEMHGGTVELSSEGQGRGTVVTVRVPIDGAAPQAEPPVRAVSREVPEAKTRGGCRVLIVDDNIDSADMLNLMLPVWGHETVIAHSGSEAIEQALAFVPDVVLLDLGLPGMTGYDVAERLREEPSLADVRLVALTGYGQDDDRRRTRDAGFMAHLTKPVDMTALQQLLSEICGRA